MTRMFRVHLAYEYSGDHVRCACGYRVPEKDGLHAWVDGKDRFWAARYEDVNCKRCRRVRENYVQRRAFETLAARGR
jgi:hypothetical protein